MRHFKKTLAFTAAMALTLCSCSQTGSSQTAADTPQNATLPEISENVTITLAVLAVNADAWNKILDEFNANSENVTVVAKAFGEVDENFDYSEESYALMDMELTQNLINKNDVDLISANSFSDDSLFEIMRDKGAFADLYQFMDSDPEINRDTLNSHILSLIERDGEVNVMPQYFQVETLIGNPQYVGTKENWTADEMMSCWKNMPDGSTIAGSNTAEWVYCTMLRNNIDSFIDAENAEVHFDSPEFKRTLEFCKSFPYNDWQKNDYNYDAPNMCHNMFYNGFYGLDSYSGYDHDHEPEPLTFVGYPSSDGNGSLLSSSYHTFAISRKSSPEKQRAAWEFIRYFLTEDYQTEHYREKTIYDNPMIPEELRESWESPKGFPMNNKAAENVLQRTIDGYYTPPYIIDKDVKYECHPPKAEDCRRLWEYVNTVGKWSDGLSRSYALSEIISDEIDAYLAGEQSLDQCIDLIQNRASIWISEHQ